MSDFEESRPHSHSRYPAIVLRVQAVGDADLILSLLCLGYGKLSVLAKQARKSRKRFGSSFDLFDSGQFELKQGRGRLPLVQGFIPGRSFRRLREDLDRLTLASLLSESFEGMLQEEGQADSEHHPLLLSGLGAIDSASTLEEALRATFETMARLLELNGYLDRSIPELPTANNLLSLLALFERSTERPLRTKSALLELLKALQRRRAKEAENG